MEQYFLECKHPILFVTFYIFLNKFEILSLKNISYNYYIIVQIFLVSAISFINLILVRSTKILSNYNKNLLLYLAFYIFSFILFKYTQLDIIYLSAFHIASMLSYLYLSCNFLTKIIPSKKILYLKKILNLVSLMIIIFIIFNLFL